MQAIPLFRPRPLTSLRHDNITTHITVAINSLCHRIWLLTVVFDMGNLPLNMTYSKVLRTLNISKISEDDNVYINISPIFVAGLRLTAAIRPFINGASKDFLTRLLMLFKHSPKKCMNWIELKHCRLLEPCSHLM